MLLLLFALSLAFVSPVAAHAAAAKEPEGYQWRLTEMYPSIIEVDLLPGATTCDREKCTFGLHYFLGEGYKPGRKSILFVPGGPGEIVDPQKRPLAALEKYYNVVYFHVRGTGVSMIPNGNKYDNFLRAKYVVEDIERIRKALKIDAWAAIYAHSWGTIVAQLYAEKSEQMSHENGIASGVSVARVVEGLILSAPVARAHKNTEDARRAMLVTNLKDIYRNYNNNLNRCSMFFRSITIDLVRTIQRAIQGIIKTTEQSGDRGKADDFCFVSSELVDHIDAKLAKVLKDLDNSYGSVGFVLANYDNLVGTETNDFTKQFPYPKEFYLALQRLQFMGASERPLLPDNDPRRQMKFNAALLLGYYLTLPDEAFENTNHELNPLNEENFGCSKNAPFLKGLPIINERLVLNVLRGNLGEADPETYWHTVYCGKVIDAVTEIGIKRAGSASERAHDVFSVYDGLSRSSFETFRKHERLDENECFHGKDIQDVANGVLYVNDGLRATAKKLGVDVKTKICPWAPAAHRHSTPTLILKGLADPVIAGGQAEEVFQNGLSGNRILIEFPGVGHGGILSKINVESQEMSGDEILAEVVKEFLDSMDDDDDVRTRQREMRHQIHKKLHSVINIIKEEG